MSRLMLVIGKVLFTILFFSNILLAQEKIKIEPVFKTDDIIWGFKFLPDRRILFTERSGKLKIFDPQSKKITSISGAPQVLEVGQGGLLDVALHPQFAKNSYIYLVFSHGEAKKNTTALGRGVLRGDTLKDFKIIFKEEPAYDSSLHFGSRIVFDDKGFLYFTTGDRFHHRNEAQKLDNHLGKVIRLKDDGSVPSDNPFVNDKNAKPEIWTYGHRNPQGLHWSQERKQLWMTDHGPRGGDEINLIEPGKNYGWPVITYGREYWGPKIGSTHKEGMEQPIHQYTPSIATSNLSFYTGGKIKEWQGNLFVGALKLTHVSRLVLEGNKVIKEERLLEDWGKRIRDIQQGPDGWLYLSTDSGELVRLVK